MDIFNIIPYAAAVGIGVVTLIIVYNYFIAKKLAPTDEPIVGEYRIELDVGTHIVPIEGTLYYFNKLLNPQNIHVYAKAIDQTTKQQLQNLQNYLKDNAHFYAMRQGTKKYAIISINNPIEVSPYFKSEQGTGKKIVHARGTISDTEDGLQHITFEPLDLQKNTPTPETFEKLSNTGQLLTTLQEKAPLLEEINIEQRKKDILQSKVNDLEDEVGELKDEVEYYKHLAKKQGYMEDGQEGTFQLPKLITQIIPFGLLFIAGFMAGPTIAPTIDPAIMGAVFAGTGFIGKWIYNNILK